MLMVITGSSGSGKTELAKEILNSGSSKIRYHKSYTTRDKRNDEDDMFYNFVDVETFKTMAKENRFIEYEEVYPNNFYGTPIINDDVDKDEYIVMIKDVVGATSIKNEYDNNCLVVMLKVDDINILIDRLKKRDGSVLSDHRINKLNYENNYNLDSFDVILKTDINLPYELKNILFEKYIR